MIPLPLRDDNPRSITPVVTIALIVVNAIFWLYQVSHGVFETTFDYGAIPSFLLHGTRDGLIRIPGQHTLELHQEVPYPFTLFTSMFMHGSWLHIIGNMWFLWIFGDNVEEAMGRVKFLLFYLLGGLAAAGAQVLASPSSSFPMVGASGAIAAVLGAYVILYPHARVKCLWILIVFITTIWLPAWLLLGLWFISQFFIPMGAGVAWMAHVGGFLAGVVLVKLFARRRPPPPPARVVWSN
jgi:membrane associated rhomboid family serine protease